MGSKLAQNGTPRILPSLNLDLTASPLSAETEDIENEGLPYLAKVECFQIHVFLKTHLSQAYPILVPNLISSEGLH